MLGSSRVEGEASAVASEVEEVEHLVVEIGLIRKRVEDDVFDAPDLVPGDVFDVF